MSESEDLERRVSALEHDVRHLGTRVRRSEHDAAAARVLAGAADRDVTDVGGEVRQMRAELRVFRDQNNRLQSALREDLAGLRQHLDAGFARVDARFAEMDAPT